MKHLKDDVISLDGDWTLYYVKDSSLKKDGYRERLDDTLATPMLSTKDALKKAGYPSVLASVPGNFELSLFEAGVCEDPFFGSNVEKMQAYECYHQYYCRHFSLEALLEGMELVFEGIDTAAEVFLNGEQILVCENMFIAHTASVERALRQGENELVVHIKPAVLYAARYPTSPYEFALKYNYESLHLRKAASTFGWDIMPRLCCGGIWRSVYLRRRPQTHISDVFGYTVQTQPAEGKARLCFRYLLHSEEDSMVGWHLELRGSCQDSKFVHRENLRYTAGQIVLDLNDAKLWMPRNYGVPYLYHVEVVLFQEDVIKDRCAFRMGIRTVDLNRTSVVTADGKGEFAFSVNGQRIFVMGTNWVPLDSFHSKDQQRLTERLPLLTDIGCNMVRCWGGNVYEDEKLFDFCDENGILIWQDFAMGCGVYPQDEDFCGRLQTEVEAVVRKYRNHPSLVLWAGDNECDIAREWGGTGYRNPNENILTRRVIPAVLQREDVSRPYLPSSPYIDETAYQTGLPPTEDHTWGPRDYFKGAYYRNTVCRFASEVGYHGCPSPESLRQFLSPEYLWNWRDREGRKTHWGEHCWDAANREWLLHASCMETDPNNPYAYRIPLMTQQIVTLFGEEPSDLETYSAMSQISQAEAKKFFIESFRIHRECRSGVIWWNLVDGWPQISDAVVDYYGRKKLAYSYIKRSQQPLALMCDEPMDGKIGVYGVNDLREGKAITYRVTDLTSGTVYPEKHVYLPSDSSLRIDELEYSDGDRRFYLLEWQFDDVKSSNHYISGMEQTLSYEEYVRCARLAGYLTKED